MNIAAEIIFMRRGNVFFKFLSISTLLFVSYFKRNCEIRCTRVTFSDELMLFESSSKLTVCGFSASFNVFLYIRFQISYKL